MLKIELADPPTGTEPTPQFATDAEVAIAQRLRHRLEEIYLGQAVDAEELLARPTDVHEVH
jgi:hypothetical protein